MSGGGVGGMMKPPGLQPHAGGVADERDPGVGAEIAHVMRRVARRVGDVEIAAAGRDPLAAAQDVQIASAGTGRISPHSRSISSPHSRVALAISFDGSTMCGAPFSCT